MNKQAVLRGISALMLLISLAALVGCSNGSNSSTTIVPADTTATPTDGGPSMPPSGTPTGTPPSGMPPGGIPPSGMPSGTPPGATLHDHHERFGR